MKKPFALPILLALVALSGCAQLESYHKPATLSDMPGTAIVGFSRAYPNATVQSITEETMMDGVVRYAILVTDARQKPMTVTFRSDGTQVH